MEKYIKLLLTSFFLLSMVLVSCDKDSEEEFSYLEQNGRRELTGRIDQEGMKPFAQTRLALDAAELEKIAPSNDFTFRFFRESYEDSTNMLLSPLGFQMTLAMAGNIAKDSDAVCKTLGFGGEDLDGVNTYFKHLIESLGGELLSKELTLANTFMADTRAKKYPDSFLDVLGSSYFADYHEIEAKSLVEQPKGQRPEDIWCQEETDGMIKVAPFPILETQSSILNIFSFKGDWQDKFDKKLTKNSLFFINPEEFVSVPFMNKQSKVNYYENDDLRAVSLPFEEGLYDLSIILPKNNYDVAGVIEGLGSDSWDTMRKSFGKKEIKLSVPIFSASYKKEMMIDLTFIDGVTPFDKIGQNAIFQMDESGASAAAVTQVITPTMNPSDIQSIEPFIANQPFIYTITESGSGLILFIGTYCGTDKNQ